MDMSNVKALALQNVRDIQTLQRWNQDITALARMNEQLVTAIKADDPNWNPEGP